MNGIKSITQNKFLISYIQSEFPVFPPYFPLNKIFWQFLLKQIPLSDFAEKVKEALPVTKSLLISSNFLSHHDICTFYTEILFCIDEIIIQEFFESLSFLNFEYFMEI